LLEDDDDEVDNAIQKTIDALKYRAPRASQSTTSAGKTRDFAVNASPSGMSPLKMLGTSATPGRPAEQDVSSPDARHINDTHTSRSASARSRSKPSSQLYSSCASAADDANRDGAHVGVDKPPRAL